LVGVALDLTASLTDQAVDLFDRLIGTMFRKANERHARAFQADGRAINEKVRLYARVGAALIAARDNKQDAFDAITAVIPWNRFLATVAEAMTLARSEEFDAYQMLGEHYAGIRRWAPAFLDAFVFQSVPAAAALMRAIDTLRDMNRRAVPSLPKSAPISFIRERWARHVFRAGGIDRRYYELCVLSELRDRLRAGDVWVVGSRRYRAFEERLISRETLKELEQGGTLPIAVDADFERFISARRARLNERLAAIDVKAKGGLLPDVMLEKGVLKITPIEKSTPPEAEALAARLYAMLPRIRITDLLSEVARWTLFTDCFTHLRTGETAADSQVLMASLLADGLNLGLTRMAEACSIASLGQLAWTADWHIRDETYALALRRLVDQQQREPLAAMFGSGFASSSDGQFFRAGGFGRDASSINAHYGDEPGVKFYTHLSDRYAPFHTKVIAATASEAAHVLDGLLYHQSEVVARRHHTDGGGDSDHVFALCSLLGFQFAPRIPDLKSRRLYSFGKASAYPSLEPLIAGRINVALIRAHWSDPAGRRLDPYEHRDRLSDPAPARLLPAAERPRRGAARAGAARTHAVHPRLAGRSRTAASDRPGAQQRRIAQQPREGRLHPSPGRDPRPHIREPATPRFRAEPSRHRNHPVEYAIPRARHCRSAPGRGCSGPATRSPVPARLGTCEPHRGLHLERRATGRGKL